MKDKNIKNILRNYVLPVILPIGLFLFVNMSLCKVIVVNGDSMYPTLHNGDLGVSQVVHKNTDIKRNDIVTIKIDDGDKSIIKRVIGLPGEKIVCTGDRIYIDNELYDQYYLNENINTDPFTVTLNEDEYFVLGDNRDNSKDSRFYGAFKREDIILKNVFVVSPENFGSVK